MRILVSAAFLALSLTGTAGAQADPTPIRLSTPAFGVQAEIEIRDLPRAAAEEVARRALLQIFELSRLFDPQGSEPGGLGSLNAMAGQGPQVLDSRVVDLIRRGQLFCLWTNGAHGVLGGDLYQLWDGASDDSWPDPSRLRDAVLSASCGRLTLTLGESSTVEIAAGTRVAPVALGRGYALDHAADVLQKAGVGNAWLEIGGVWRAMGDGPEGEGWLAVLPPPPGLSEPLDRVWLRDQSLAIASIQPLDGEAVVRLIDQRTGVPARGTVSVIVVTELAIDAEALAATLFISGLREGQMRLGGLDPRPSVYWLLGNGRGSPLESTYRWSELSRPPRRRRP